jgi:hypothetical protein
MSNHDFYSGMIEKLRERVNEEDCDTFSYFIKNVYIDVIKIGNMYFEEMFMCVGDEGKEYVYTMNGNMKCYLGGGCIINNENDTEYYIELLKKNKIVMNSHSKISKDILSIDLLKLPVSNIENLKDINYGIESVSWSDSCSVSDMSPPQENKFHSDCATIYDLSPLSEKKLPKK